MGLWAAATPASLHAANGNRPRTAAVFSGHACVQEVAQGEALGVTWSVAYDDVELTPEELPDSRTMQLFAFREVPFDYGLGLPRFITQADFDRAQDNGDITEIFDDADILERSSAFGSGDWVRVTPDDPRMPITMAQGAEGVSWDTTDVAPGPWIVSMYTWEPEKNIWSFRHGAVRVVEAGAEDDAPPAAYFPMDGQPPPTMAGEPYAFDACIAAPPGSTYTASYGILEGVTEPQWVPFLQDAPVSSDDGSGEDLSIEVVPPAEAGNASIKVRLQVTAPDGSSHTVYTPFPLTVLPDPDAMDDGEDDVGPEGEDGEDDDGGGCRAAPRRPRVAWMLPVLALLGWRRRLRHVVAR